MTRTGDLILTVLIIIWMQQLEQKHSSDAAAPDAAASDGRTAAGGGVPAGMAAAVPPMQRYVNDVAAPEVATGRELRPPSSTRFPLVSVEVMAADSSYGRSCQNITPPLRKADGARGVGRPTTA